MTRMRKSLTLLFCSVLLCTVLHSEAQDQHFMGSEVKLLTGVNDSVKYEINKSAVISLNDQSNQFAVTVSLFPLVDNPDQEDSLALQNNLLQLTFSGQFPIDEFSFYADKNDGNSYTMNGMLTVNGISKPYTLAFIIRTSRQANPLDQTIPLSDEATFYSARISFAIRINPADYGLDAEPIALKHDVSVEIADGIINKLY